MTRKSQVTVFIIIGILILLISMLMIFAYQNSIKSEGGHTASLAASHTNQVQLVERYVVDHLKRVSDEAIWRVGLQGGYTQPSGNVLFNEAGSSDYVSYTSKEVPLFLITDSNHVPNKVDIEKRLEDYIFYRFIDGLDLAIFDDQGFKISRPIIDANNLDFNFADESLNSDVIINENTIFVTLDYPITLEVEGILKTEISEFKAVIPIRLGYLHDLSGDVISEIYTAWDSGLTYDLSVMDLDAIDPISQTRIYLRQTDESDPDAAVLLIYDYSLYYNKDYRKTYIYQFAVHKQPIDLTN